MGVQHRALALVSGLMIMVLGSVLASEANAYCVTKSTGERITDSFDDLRIPVYVASVGNASIEHTGISTIPAARIIIDVIARHNETVTVPKLYFAGLLEQDFGADPVAPFAAWPKGIVVSSFPCDILTDPAISNNHLCNADVYGDQACAGSTLNEALEYLGFVRMLPPQCEHAVANTINWSMSATPNDFAGVLLHEIGHALGLQHTNPPKSVCTGEFGNDPNGNSGVMIKPQTGLLANNRAWRRDDLDGLEELFGTALHETAVWNDDVFPAYPDISEQLRISGPVRRTASVAGDSLGRQIFVSVDDEQRVLEAILGADASVVQEFTVVEPGAAGRTWGNPEIAIGSAGGVERALVTWTSGESTTSFDRYARWALRDLPDGAWTYLDGFALNTPRLMVGFDPNSASYLLTTLSFKSHPELWIVDFNGELVSERIELLDMPVFEVGNVVCGLGQADCTLLASTSAIGGPSLARLAFVLDVQAAAVSSVSFQPFDVDVFGRVALAPDGRDWRGTVGWGRSRFGAGSGSPPTPYDPPSFALRDWSLGLGAHHGVTGGHRLTMPVAVACGNGVLEADEQCDDGNLVDGDGCDRHCMVEDPVIDDEPPDEDEDDGDSEGTGGGFGLDEGDGCGCTLGARRLDPTALGLVVLMLLGVGRRCRSPRSLRARQPRDAR
jgi:cysteine-rich repeat protein